MPKLTKQTAARLCMAAAAARENAYAPYSQFAVGAAILGEDGRIYSGCNVENASYGLTICAERNAAAHAVAEGCRRFLAIAIATESHPPATPCGACRQVLAEFAADMDVALCDSAGKQVAAHRLAALLPERFGPGAGSG